MAQCPAVAMNIMFTTEATVRGNNITDHCPGPFYTFFLAM